MTRLRTILAAGAATALCLTAAGAVSQTAPDRFMRMEPGGEKWFPYPGQGGQLGIQEAILYGDPAKPGVYVIRMKFPVGVMSHPHSHPDDRLAVVIKGTWWAGVGDVFDPASTRPLGPGGFMAHPHGEVHYDGARGEEVIVQLTGMGPTGKTASHPDQPDFTKQ